MIGMREARQTTSATMPLKQAIADQAARGEAVGVGGAVLAARASEPERHEGAIERAFRQQAAEKIDDLEDDEKRFRDGPAPSSAAMPASRA